MGQRTRKVVVNTDNTISTTVYHYDFQGMLISETNERGEPIKDYIWLDYAPIAQIEYDAIADSDTIYYLHTDHLMTPRFATDSGGNIVWRWEGEAFGDTLSKSDPDGNGKDVVVNLRFAGQYYDSESQLHYNYFRYYDPTTGRYITHDPIGLYGGINTYGYVEGNPLYWSDYYGLSRGRTTSNPRTSGSYGGRSGTWHRGRFYPSMGENYTSLRNIPVRTPSNREARKAQREQEQKVREGEYRERTRQNLPDPDQVWPKLPEFPDPKNTWPPQTWPPRFPADETGYCS